MNATQINWDEDLRLSSEESYQALLRSLQRTKGFNLLFVRCSPAEGDRIIKNVRSDLPKKTIEVMSLEEPIDNLYNRVAALPNLEQINVLFIKGIEHSIYEYEDAEYGDINLRSRSKVYGGTWKGVPRLFGHLNLSRERFRDNFNICFVFLVSEFTLRYFIRRAPDFFDWHSNVFEIPSNLKQIEQEIAHNNGIIELDSNYNAWLSSGVSLYLLGQHEEAIAAYDKALEIKPDMHWAWNNKGAALASLGRYEEAIAAYDKALELKPDKHEAWFNKGVTLGNLGRYEEAIAAYDKALEIKPDKHAAWNNKGIALRKLGLYEEVIAAYDKALEIKPYEHAWYNKGVALANQGRYEEAIAAYDKALEIKTDMNEAWNNKGTALGRLDRYEEAIAAFDKALKIKTGDQDAWYNKGIALAYLGRYEEAIATLDKALKIKPDSPRPLYGRACTYALQDEVEPAVDNLWQAIQLSPDEYRNLAKTDSDFDRIRSDPRFQALIK
jgi:tetratricopeptide (TPR) repeat protein